MTTDDEALLTELRRYRREVAKRYRVLDDQSAERLLPSGNLWISTKLDGELWFLVKRGDDVSLRAYNGRALTSGPLIAAAKKKLAKEGDGIWAGEMIAVPDEGRPRVQHVMAALSNPEKAGRLSFFVYDVVRENGAPLGARPYAERLAHLRALFGEENGSGGGQLAVVTTVEGSAKDVLTYYGEWVGTQRFEGVVVRSETGFTYKIKPTFTIDAVIVAYGARIENGRPELRELSIAIRRDDGLLHLFGSVGNGFSAADRVAWHGRLAAMEVPSKFRMANRDGTLCRFVRPEIVIEIQCADLLETDAYDRSIRRMTLSYDAEGGYAPKGDAAIAAMLFPIFQRERKDKTTEAVDIGLDQVTRRLPIDEGAPVLAESRTPYAVLERHAYTKGETAVRKVIVYKRREGAGDVAPYLVYTTDFSAGRSEPLKTGMAPASTEESAKRRMAEWIAENVKKGWVEATTSAAQGALASAASAPTEEAAAEAKLEEPGLKKAKAPKRASKTKAEEAPPEGAAVTDADAPPKAPAKRAKKASA